MIFISLHSLRDLSRTAIILLNYTLIQKYRIRCPESPWLRWPGVLHFQSKSAISVRQQCIALKVDTWMTRLLTNGSVVNAVTNQEMAGKEDNWMTISLIVSPMPYCWSTLINACFAWLIIDRSQQFSNRSQTLVFGKSWIKIVFNISVDCLRFWLIEWIISRLWPKISTNWWIKSLSLRP